MEKKTAIIIGAGPAMGLLYRDFITVGLLLKELKIKNTTKLKTFKNINKTATLLNNKRTYQIEN